MDSRQAGGMLPAMNPMLLQHTLRGLCTDSQWVYAVFWRILPRNYPPPQWDTDGGIMDRSKGNKRNWILVWEDGFCDFSACASGTGNESTRAASSSFLATRQLRPNVDDEPEAMNPELFFKMSHEVYNYGEGLMGKVAVDNSHKWVYKEPLENEISFLSPWHASLDPHPRTWEAQFKSGIQTIAVVAVQEGVLQLGSTKRVMEDLSFVLYMQRKFNFLHSIPGVFVPHSTSGSGTKRPSPPTGLPLPSPFDASQSHSQLTLRSIDQFLSPRMGAPDLWRPMSNIPSTGVTGMKRPPEPTSQSLNLKEYAYFNGFECRPESSPSPPKALNTGHTSPQGATSPTLPTLLPSMSSLQALLSKLPSVTHSLDAESTIHGLPSSGIPCTGFTSNRPPISRSVSKAPKEEICNGKRMLKGEVMDSGSTSDVGDVDTVDDPQPSCNMADHAHESTTFLESFENLNEYGIPEALENGDSSYSSFLNEICS
ncbi:hypothetical protein KC19_1G192100 [Ceratodon purpureus]|uniref:Transcription factor MYC/MYB N-terminal domain-containing protein n=1 Tax=Ceratodon purpureus TaxID=3225 RepID=A0A8T0J8U5_CERPU|nr:hypothetical protein KC19_1G192100 [Ceratodon purpureus]